MRLPRHHGARLALSGRVRPVAQQGEALKLAALVCLRVAEGENDKAHRRGHIVRVEIDRHWRFSVDRAALCLCDVKSATLLFSLLLIRQRGRHYYLPGLRCYSPLVRNPSSV